MTTKYLKYFPQPLLDDLVRNCWLPIVGAGLSKNAILSSKRTMPLWNDLGKSFAEDIRGFDYVNPIDAISAYENEFSRPKLIEKLSELLFLGEARPGETHRAFCSMQFDIVCTTNFDFLLEQQYELTSMSCIPLIDEEQLSINLPGSSVALLKIHGDLNHPKRLVVTEEDYDAFLERYPVIATYLANLLITRTAVLIGYSLDDPDFRQIWQVVGERLGKARRLAYALCVGARSADIARFERRGVKVINLPGSKSKYGEILCKAFEELRDHWQSNIVVGSQVIEEEPRRELSLPSDSITRLCYFALPLSAHPFYREQVFPLVRESGFVPVTADEIISPGENIIAKIEALISRAFLTIGDASSDFAVAELRMALERNKPGRICVILEEGSSIPFKTQNFHILRRPDLASVQVQKFLDSLEDWLRGAARELEPELALEARRLLHAKEYRAAVISAITHLETTLREQLDIPSAKGRKIAPVSKMLYAASDRKLLGPFKAEQVLQWLRVRNDVVHSRKRVYARKAEEIVNGVEEILTELSQKSN